MILIQTIATVLMAIVGILGFWGLIIQLRKVDRQLRISARGDIFAMAARMKEVFVQRPEMRPLFFDGKRIERDDASYSRAVAIADYYCLYLEQIATQVRSIDPRRRESWLRYVSGIYHASPIVRDYLADKRSWYASDLWKAIEEYAPSSQQPEIGELEQDFGGRDNTDDRAPQS